MPIPTTQFDYLVIGSGLAGLSFALEAASYGKVAVVTKADAFESNTSWAQGGIAAAVGEADNWNLHEEDTLVAGAGLCNPEAVRFLVQSAPAAIEWLEKIGAKFDSGPDGRELGLEGGHSKARIVHHGDNTGWEIERAVLEAVRAHPSIAVYENTFVTTLLRGQDRIVGARTVSEAGTVDIYARAVVLATGGCGRMYRHTTNPWVATGDGIALAHAAGAKVENMEFMQFHPTTLYHNQIRSFLITEAVRGAGATLRNHTGSRFMYQYDQRLELAPRDIVARAIDSELKRLDTWCVYLDAAHLPPDRLKHEFPTVYRKLADIGILMERDWIPIVPAQHYSCGGVCTNLTAQTSLAGLYAAGEVACTGVHGANRLASNSLLEALVFARAAAEAVKEEPSVASNGEPIFEAKPIREEESITLRRAMAKTMTANVGIVRTNRGLNESNGALKDLIDQFDSQPTAPYTRYSLEVRNLLVAASLVVSGAIERKENVGLHFNQDQEVRKG